MTTTGRSVSSARANRELITRRRASTRRRPADPPAGLMGTTEEERIPYPPRWLLVDRGVLPRTARRQNPSSQGPMESLGARSAVAPVAARAPSARRSPPAASSSRARARRTTTKTRRPPPRMTSRNPPSRVRAARPPPPRRRNGSEPRKERVARDGSSSRPASPPLRSPRGARARSRHPDARGACDRRPGTTDRDGSIAREARERTPAIARGRRAPRRPPIRLTRPPPFPST